MSTTNSYKWTTAYQDLTDLELVELYQEKEDLHLVGALFYRYYDLLYGLGLKYLQSAPEAEDACYEVFELLINKLRSHQIKQFKPWLYRLASNYCIDKIRKAKRHKLSMVNSHLSIEREMTFELDVTEDQRERLLQRIDDCMRQLTTNQRECIDLFYFKEKSYNDIASLLEISWSKTRSHIQNGKRNLKICMEKI